MQLHVSITIYLLYNLKATKCSAPQTSFMYLKVVFHFIININLKLDLIVKQEMNEKSEML